jgi:hypothetical protein
LEIEVSTLANRDWYIADTQGKPIKVRCLSQNYVLGTARVVDNFGNYGEVDAHSLKYTPEEILAMNLPDETATAETPMNDKPDQPQKRGCRICLELTSHDLRCRLAKGLNSPVLDSERVEAEKRKSGNFDFYETRNGKWVCKTCGSTIKARLQHIPIHDGPFPFSGSGQVETIELPFCPNCEETP